MILRYSTNLIVGASPPATMKLQKVLKNDFLMNREQRVCAHNAKQQENCKIYLQNSTVTLKRKLHDSDVKSWKPLVGLVDAEQNPNLWQSSGDKFIFQYQVCLVLEIRYSLKTLNFSAFQLLVIRAVLFLCKLWLKILQLSIILDININAR